MSIRLITLGELDRQWSGRWNLGQAMNLPVPTIHVHHTVTEDTGDPIADARKVHDIDQGRFGKISYSWLVHESSGSWIEGETVHRGAHTINNANQSLNGISFGVGVIGNFHPAAPIPPPRPASDALIALIAAGIREFIVDPGLISAGFVIDGHRDVYATACCGDNLYSRLPIVRALVSSPEEDDMPAAPAVVIDGPEEWTFVRGTNGELFARSKAKDWFSLGGTLTSGPAATVVPGDGRIVINARGQDGATWRLVLDKDGKVTEGWKSLGGRS